MSQFTVSVIASFSNSQRHRVMVSDGTTVSQAVDAAGVEVSGNAQYTVNGAVVANPNARTVSAGDTIIVSKTKVDAG